jgi:hypothetical protein
VAVDASSAGKRRGTWNQMSERWMGKSATRFEVPTRLANSRPLIHICNDAGDWRTSSGVNFGLVYFN